MRTSPPLLLAVLMATAAHIIVALAVWLLQPKGTPQKPAALLWTPVELVTPREETPPPRLIAEPKVKRRPRAASTRRSPNTASVPAQTSVPKPRPAPMSLRMRPLDLSPSLDPSPGKPPQAGNSTPNSRVGRRVANWLHRGVGERNVTLGLCPPVLFRLLRRMRRHFAPTDAVVPQRLRHAGREYLAAYRAGIDAFNRRSRAMPLDDHDVGQVNTRPRPLVDGTAFKRGVRPGTQWLATEVCVEARPGRHPTIVAQRGSRSKALGRLARRAVEEAAAVTVVPVDTPASRACYRFAVEFGQILPGPSKLLCAIRCWLSRTCHVPGGLFRYRVNLVAVWPQPAADAPRQPLAP